MKYLKYIVKRIPRLYRVAEAVYFTLFCRPEAFPGSKEYWKDRYRRGGNSGDGSYGKLAVFKSEILNGFVEENSIETIIEYGCGDGNQLSLSKYPSYLGFDVSPEAISRCNRAFANDETKSFLLMDKYTDQTAQLTLSLDVIYHLVEDDVFHEYMSRLFDSSTKFVIIYSSNIDQQMPHQPPHVRHRRFSRWIDANRPEWKLIKHIPNRYPYSEHQPDGALAEFFIYAAS